MRFPILPDQAATSARHVDHLMLSLLGIALFFIILIGGLIAYFSFRYRRGNVVNRVIRNKGSFKLEVAWTLTALGIGLLLYVYSASVYFRLRHPPAEAMEIHVIGKQWMWKIQHPDGKREINALHVPVGVPVKLLMTSQDVIHSFFIPAFRTKQDVLPGYYTTQWFVADKPGRYHLFCAEYCGNAHARMIGQVDVLSRDAYQEWLRTGPVEEGPVVAGARLFRELGCSGCHVGSPVVHAPDLNGLFGSMVQLEGGRSVLADERYLRDSILLPNSQIVHGYQPIMPSFQGQVSEGDLMALISYLKSLGRAPEGSAPVVRQATETEGIRP